MHTTGRRAFLPALLLGLMLCGVAYWPGLHGDFIFDDVPNIVQNERLHVDSITLDGLRQAAFSADSGILKRPLSMLSFWLNYYSTGLDPFYFKLTNLLIHLANGLGLFWLTRLLLVASPIGAEKLQASTRDWVAVAVATAWLVHPLNLTAVLYAVQRMTSLSATFVIFGLVYYVLGRQRLARGAPGFPLIFLGLAGFGSLAILSKENGALLPLYMAAIEFTLFRFAGIEATAAKKLRAFFLIFVGLPVLLALAFLITHPAWISHQYQTRDFTPIERLLTEARVLWFYLRLVVAPNSTDLGLFHDDIVASHGLLHPMTTLLAIIGLVALVGAAIRFRKQAPAFAFAVFWYLAGHVLESSIIGLELVFEHRNYLPMYGPLFAGILFLIQWTARPGRLARFAIPAALVACLTVVTAARSSDWGDVVKLRMALVRHHPGSARSNYQAAMALGTLALKNPKLGPVYYDRIRTYLERSVSLDETAFDGLFGLMLLNATNDRPFNQEAFDELEARLAAVPLNFTVIEPFRSLVDWTSHRVLVVPRANVLGLFEAALGNPTGDSRTRAALLSILSSYYFNVISDPQEAVSLALAAAQEDPTEPAHHLSLANLAWKLGNADLATRELTAVSMNDPMGRFTAQARELAVSLLGTQTAASEQQGAEYSPALKD